MADRLNIAKSRCYNHPTREAVALCTVTGKPFCRECIVEHEGKMVSAEVVAELLATTDDKQSSRWRRLFRWGLATGCFLLLWYGFYLLGSLLLRIPARFHEGHFW